MNSDYDFVKIEKESQDLWNQVQAFKFDSASSKKPFAMFMMPPNTSGPMHIGNSLMIALQDILARYHRVNNRNVLWVPGLDHGGYETQVTYEREQEKNGIMKTREEYNSAELFTEISQFVELHKKEITTQIKSLGASMDLSQMLYTMDDSCVEFVQEMFANMTKDGVVERSNYMMNYCPECATVLADIEIKKTATAGKEYIIKFCYPESSEYIEITTTQPEMLYSMDYILVHPHDKRFAELIGAEVVNPITGASVTVISSIRTLNWHQENTHITAFYPAFERYDYEYAVRNDIPVVNQLDWEGKFEYMYLGKTLAEARIEAVQELSSNNAIVSQNSCETEQRTCKKNHEAISLIKLAWFLNIDNEQIPLRKNAIEAFEKEDPVIYTNWRKKGVADWLKKMPNWPISRQNVWGIKLPVHYEVTDSSEFLVWFFDKTGLRQHGNLKSFLKDGYTLEEIQSGLQRVYASEECTWTLEPEIGKRYLSETDTLDTWFSSTVWGVYVYKQLVSANFEDYYPSENIILGHDLLRLFIARKVLLGVYLTGKLPFKRVHFHPLINGADGQKMSKSLGNSVTLNEYIKQYGADVTRFALVARLDSPNDFAFTNSHLDTATEFMKDLFRISQAYNLITGSNVSHEDGTRLDDQDFAVAKKFQFTSRSVAKNVEKYNFQKAQLEVENFLVDLEGLINNVVQTGSHSSAVAFLQLFKKYLILLHPFAPHITEHIFQTLSTTQDNEVLANTKL